MTMPELCGSLDVAHSGAVPAPFTTKESPGVDPIGKRCKCTPSLYVISPAVKLACVTLSKFNVPPSFTINESCVCGLVCEDPPPEKPN